MKTLILALVLAVCSGLLAQDTVAELESHLKKSPGDEQTLLQLAIAYHDRGATGDKKAVKKGLQYLDQLLEKNPGNALAWAYHGSLMTMKGRDAWFPLTKKKYVEKGCDELDRAVELNPDNIRIRLTRAINSLKLPAFFHRLSYARKDLTFLREHPGFPDFDDRLKSLIYFYSGMLAERDKSHSEALAFYQHAKQLSKDSAIIEQCEKAIQQLETAE